MTFGQLCYEVRRELHLALTMMAMAGAWLAVKEIGGWQMVTAAIGLTLVHAYCFYRVAAFYLRSNSDAAH